MKFLHIIGFGNLNTKLTDSIIQWTKFYNLFNNIKIILSANLHNIVILDRTPYSENIWNRFFNRQNSYNNDIILKDFLSQFKSLNEKIQFISLNVNSTILADRILTSETDKNNYINAFDQLYKTINNTNENNDLSKILFMINKVNEEFNNLYLLLRQYNIDVTIYDNNSYTDMNFIISEIMKKIKQ